MCNKFLLEEPFSEYPLNLGERAHIAGWTDASGSPRGDSDLPLADRGKAENLILLCQDHHKFIDTSIGDYPEERLLEIKRAHEERIHHLTGMASDRETTVLRVFGMVRGSMPELAREQAMQTVIDAENRYARFPLSYDRHSIELNLSQISDPESIKDAYWEIGREKIDGIAKRVAEAVHEKQIRHLSIFALTRIPLLIYLGYALDDKVPVDIYQKHRGKDEGWIWPEDNSAHSFEIVKHREGENKDKVALILNLSGTIGLGELPAEAAEVSVYEIRLVGDTPGPDVFRSKLTLDAFTRIYRQLLAQLEQTDKGAATIHLFPAVPISAAIQCGRQLMRHVHPALIVYDRIGNEFQPTIEINQR